MARVAGAVQRQKTRKCTGKIYSSEQIAKQLAVLDNRLIKPKR